MALLPGSGKYKLTKWLSSILGVIMIAGFAKLGLFSDFTAGVVVVIAIFILAWAVGRSNNLKESQAGLVMKAIGAGVAIGMAATGLLFVAFVILLTVAFASGGGFGSSK
ncbi:MAG TPA: hypothetical protein VMS08_03320 [Candidatus Saccharimonadia bacterium]|nr:hypothetical protein [Candidatus Saccharimonadia bacterium]